jgi:hypothetical protein
MARARAIEQPIDESVPVPVEKVREALLEIISSRLTTYQSGQAASKAAKLLSIIDGEVEEPETESELSHDEQVEWLQMDVLFDLRAIFGWNFPPGPTARQLRWLDEQADVILNDPVGLALPDPSGTRTPVLRDPHPGASIEYSGRGGPHTPRPRCRSWVS